MSWPTTTIEIVDYEGWRATLYDPTLGDMETINDSVNAGDWASVITGLVGVVKDWTFVDREGQPVPITEDGIRQLPMPVILQLQREVNELVRPRPFQEMTSTSDS